MRRLVALLWLGLPVAGAWADQCQLVSKDQALRAVARLEVGRTVYEFCEPCGDRLPRPMVIKALGATSGDVQNFWQVIVNGKNIDLAYTFIDSGIDSPPVNLAIIANCPAQSISPVLPLGTRTR